MSLATEVILRFTFWLPHLVNFNFGVTYPNILITG
jgi:hypothetical protein